MNKAIIQHLKNNPNVRMGMPAASGPEKMQELEIRIVELEEVVGVLIGKIEALEKKPAAKPKTASKPKKATE